MLRKLVLSVLASTLVLAAPVAGAELDKIKIAEQFGIGFLPLYVMHDHKLIEKYAKEEGVNHLEVDWVRISGGSMMNDGLLSGSLQIATGGITPLIVAWAKTVNTPAQIKGVSVFSSAPFYLLTRNPAVKTIKDFTDKDRIAMPAAKLAPQSIVLQMAAEKAFGADGRHKLDRLTVSMSHPDATVAMLSGAGEVDSHFSTPPFMYRELADPAVHIVLSADDVLGGPGTFGVMWTTTKFYEENPKIYAAIVKALDAAIAIINKDKVSAARSYQKIFDPKADVQNIVEILNKPGIRFSTTPHAVSKYADFMFRTGTIKVKPTSWKDMFLPNNDKLSGD